MDSHTERHEVVRTQRQIEAEAKEQFNTEVRKHVVNIMVTVGSCVFDLVNPNTLTGPPSVAWESLGNKICDFTEFLDAN